MFVDLSKESIEELLKTQVIGRLGCHADGVTYVIPISYAYDGSSIYMRMFEGMKLTMLRKNPAVCFQVDDTRSLSNWKSVICWGAFEEINSPTERRLAIRKMLDRSVPVESSELMHITRDWPFSDDNVENVEGLVCRIRLQKKTGKAEINMPKEYIGH